MVGGERGRRTLVRDYVRPAAGARVLDLGCGPGEMLDYLPQNVIYTGIDVSPEYIARAQKRVSVQAEFRIGDATTAGDDLRSFDLVIVLGVLHHLDDAQARNLFHGAARALKSDGRMVTVDPTFAPGQSGAARAIIARDRGRHVRSPDEYLALATEYFTSVRNSVREDLLRIPYTHCIIEATHTSAISGQAESSVGHTSACQRR